MSNIHVQAVQGNLTRIFLYCFMLINELRISLPMPLVRAVLTFVRLPRD